LDYIDLTVGTSAGSAVGAWFRSGSVTDADVIGRLEALDLSRVRAANAVGVELGAEVAERFAPGPV